MLQMSTRAAVVRSVGKASTVGLHAGKSAPRALTIAVEHMGHKDGDLPSSNRARQGRQSRWAHVRSLGSLKGSLHTEHSVEPCSYADVIVLCS